MKETTIGIDLGTTFSCVSTIDEYGKPIVLKNEEGNTITPSVVAFEQDGSVIVGDEAKNIQSLGNENVASFFKREMGSPGFCLTFHEKQYTPTDLSSYILSKLKADAEKALGRTITKAVITCPAYFNAIQREEVKKAGRLAGLEVLRVINEPTAAAIAFGIKSEKEQTLLVYDLGGGTFDVTLMKITADKIDVLATDGNHQLGGKDWDDTLREYAVEKFQEEFSSNPLEDSAMANDLLVTAENAKKALSQKTTTKFVVSYNGNKGRYEITRDQFEEATKHLINQTLTLCESVLAAKKMDWKYIDGILFVGGSTRMPQVESELKKHTDKPILHGINVDEAVAIGAAIQADLDANEKQYTLESKQNTGKYTLEGRRTIKDVTGQSLGMIAENADRTKYINSIIIPRNTNIPSCEVRPYQIQTSSSKDNEIEVYVTQGESSVPSDCAILGKYVISGLTHESGNNAVCDIEYQYDKSGTVEVAAKQRSTGKKLAVRKEEPGDMSWTDLRPGRASGLEHITVLLVLDTSGSMFGDPINEAVKAAHRFVNEVDLTHCSVGLWTVADKVVTLSKPTQDGTAIRKALDTLNCTDFGPWDPPACNFSNAGGGNLAQPFTAAEKFFSNVGGKKMMVVLADGVWSKQGHAVKEAKKCHQDGIEVAALGFGEADLKFLQAIASCEENAIFTNMNQLGESFSKIAQVITEGKTALQTI